MRKFSKMLLVGVVLAIGTTPSMAGILGLRLTLAYPPANIFEMMLQSDAGTLVSSNVSNEFIFTPTSQYSVLLQKYIVLRGTYAANTPH